MPAIRNEELTRSRVEAALQAPGDRLVFESCTLNEVDLSQLDLSDCSWVRCRAARANFGGANLTSAEFSECDLNNSRWRRAKISSASFRGCKLTGADFRETASLVPPTFEETLLVAANLQGLSFRKMLLRRVDLSDADLAGCDFRDAVLIGASLRNARIAQARFDGADLREADLSGLKLVDLRVLRGATISVRHAVDLIAELGVHVA